jgi:mannose-6-phosphate isomerase-like protein (cupin superfamily)
MAVTLDGGCRVSEMREGDPLVAGTLSIWNRIGRDSGAQAISLRVLEFAPGLSPGIRNADCDEILYVLSGAEHSIGSEVSTACDSGRLIISVDGRSHNLTPNTGIYIRPRETFAVDNRGANPIVMISSQCPDPSRPSEFVEVPSSPITDAQAPLPLVRLSDRPAQPTADRWYRVLVDDRVGSTNVTQFVGSIPPGRAPDHFHHYEEVLFILKGEGRMWAGETHTPIAPGSCIYLPKGQVHCVENTGAGELRLQGVFYPAGSPSVRYEA